MRYDLRHLVMLTLFVGIFYSNVDAQAHVKKVRRAQGPAPVDELTILDPRVDAEGKPHPQLVVGADGQRHVDIPPTVIVHNSYYSGDRDFRAPRLVGGPVVLVLNDPNSGEQLNLEAMFPAGSPRVFYRRHHIDYVFGRERVRVKFDGPLTFAQHYPRVLYLQGSAEALEPQNVSASPSPLYQQCAEAIPHVAEGTVALVQNVGKVAVQAGTQVVSPVKQVIQATPVGSLFESRSEEQAATSRNIAVRQAAKRQDLNNLTIPTNR